MGLTMVAGLAGLLVALLGLPGEIRARLGPGRLLLLAGVSVGLAALAGALSPSEPRAAHLAFLAPGFLAISAADLVIRRVPNRSIGVGLAAGLAAAEWGPAASILRALLGGLVGLTLGAVAYLAGRGTAFGAGDAKLAALVGVAVGLRLALPALFYGVLAGGLVALTFIVAGRRRATMAYGPFLSFGAIVTLLLALPD